MTTMRGPTEANKETSQWTSDDGRIFVGLAYEELDVMSLYRRVKNKQAGAIVVFSGVTRDNSVPEGEYVQDAQEKKALTGHTYGFENVESIPHPQRSLSVASLSYSSYVPLAMKTLQRLAQQALETYTLEQIAIMHRLGAVPIEEESVVICVSARHRREAWQGGEWALEEVKRKVEIWKWEIFQGDERDQQQGKKEWTGVWRSNVKDSVIRARDGRELQLKENMVEGVARSN